jgi:hypothetical protein
VKKTERVSVVVTDRMKPSIREVGFAEMPLYVRRSYRVTPDRRMLLALAELHTFGDQRAPESIQISQHGERWRVQVGGRASGDLGLIPVAEEQLELLRTSAHGLAKAGPKVVTRGDLAGIERDLLKFALPAPLDALSKLDAILSREASARRDPVILRLGSRALIFALLQSNDHYELLDDVAGRALLLSVLAEAYGENADDTVRDRALLLHWMGYHKTAAEMVEPLQPTDPVRRFVRNESPAEIDLSSSNGLHLYLKSAHLLSQQVSDEQRFDQWMTWLRKEVPPATSAYPYIAQGVRHAGFSEATALAAIGRDEVLRQLRGRGRTIADFLRPGTEAEGEDVREFEHLLESVEGSGILGDKATRIAIWRASFYSSVQREADFLIRERSAPQSGTPFIEALGLSGGPGGDIRALLELEVRARLEQIEQPEMAKRLAEFTWIAPTSLRYIADFAAENATGRFAPPLRLAVRTVFQRLDSRPAHLKYAGELAITRLYHPSLGQKYCAAYLDAVAHTDSRFARWYYLRTGHFDALRKLAEEPNSDGIARGKALRDLAESSSEHSKAVERVFESLIGTDPEIAEQYLYHLERHKDFRRAEHVGKTWLKSNIGEHVLVRAGVAAVVSHAIRRQGRPADAWTIIEPYVDTGKADVLHEAALVLDALGQKDEALKMALAAQDRYPATEYSGGTLAQIYWKRGQWAEAAEAIEPYTNGPVSTDWYFAIRTPFGETFAKAGSANATHAFKALIARDIPAELLVTLAESIGYEGNPRISHELIKLLLAPPVKEPAYAGPTRLAAYRQLREFAADDEAIGWYSSMVTPETAIDEATTFYKEEEYDLLWSIVGEASPPERNDHVKSIMALAALRQRLPEMDPRRQRVAQYFRHRATSLHAKLGRYALGMMSEEEFVTQVDSPAYRDAGALYIGMKLASNGRYEEALDWLQAATEHAGRSAASSLAADVITKWATRPLTFEQVAKKGIM